MYFVKRYTSGAADYDPRQRHWAKFHCALCNKDSHIDITRLKDFDFAIERKCNYCGLVNSDDKKQNLKAQLSKLTEDKSRLEVEINRLESELNSMVVQTTL